MCLDCVALDSEQCTYPGCGHLYEMQTPDTLARPENPNPKWPVPKDLIELQPSYKQACSAENFYISVLLGQTILIFMFFFFFFLAEKNLIYIYHFMCIQDNWDPDWQSTSSSKVAYLISKLKELQGVNSDEDYPPNHDGTGVENNKGLFCSSRMNKSNVLTQDFGCPRMSSSHKIIKEKVLVFSQFLEHIHVIEQQVK